MDFINELNEAINPGGNPVIFYIMSVVAFIVLVMILRSILQVAMILAAVLVMALGFAYYTGYDISKLNLPDIPSLGIGGSLEGEGSTSDTSEDSLNEENSGGPSVNNKELSDGVSSSIVSDISPLEIGIFDFVLDSIKERVMPVINRFTE